MNNRLIDLHRYLPPYLDEYREMYHIMEGENPEFRQYAEERNRTLNNTFIQECDENGIKRFETQLGIVSADTDTLEMRQSRVLVKYNDDSAYTLDDLKNKLIGMQGTDDVQVVLDNYTLFITTHMDEALIPAMWDLLNEIVPYNIRIEHQNMVRCDSNGVLHVGLGTNYSEFLSMG